MNMRESFEAHCLRRYGVGRGDGSIDWTVRVPDAWKHWQAAWAASARECAKVCGEKYAKHYDHSDYKHAGKELADACNRIAEAK